MGMRAGPVLVLAVCFVAPARAGSCTAQSGADTVALVELYTSNNCAGCQRAQTWLSALRPSARVLPVLLHVDGRDYGTERMPQRPRRLTPQQRLALTYTPHVLLQGREFGLWDTQAFDPALAEILLRPAGARIRLEILSLSVEGIDLAVAAELGRAGGSHAAMLYLAAYAVGPESIPLVLEWQGPFAVHSVTHVRRTLPLPPGTAPSNSGVLGFVQDRRTAEVLQALRLPAC
jgi:hypothetical protein